MGGVTTIDVLIPMLGRPDQVASVLGSLDDTAEGLDIRPVFIVSPDDREVLGAVKVIGVENIVMAAPASPGDYARKINTGFSLTEGEWVLLGASDLRFHPGWAVAAVKAGQEYGAGVVGTDDMGNPSVQGGKHSTHPLVRRSYINEYGGGWDGPGIVYHEGYAHQYVDTELVAAAQARGMWVFAHGSKVEHLHPLWGKSEMDDTYRIALERMASARDARLFRARSRQHLRRVRA